MKIIVVGAGTVGSNIAKFLSREGHEVIVVDLVRSKLTTVEDELDVQVYTGNATDPATLRALDIQKANLLLSVTERDETNLITAFAAKRMGCRRVAARVRSRFYYETADVNFRDPLGIDLLISPEISTASELANFVSMPNVLAMTTMARGRIHLRTVRLSALSEFAGRRVQDIKIPDGALIAGLRRGSDVMIARGHTVLEAEDRVTLIGLPSVLDGLCNAVDCTKHSGKLAEVAIAGAGETGIFLAELLEKRGHRVVVIERNRERAELASERLVRGKVLHGDATEISFLREERISKYDYYIAATGDDENNIMSSLLAKELGVPKAACIIDRPDYTRIVEKIGLDVAISPRFVVANRILALVKRGRLRSVTLLEEGELEINEYQALSKSAVVGQQLKDIAVPRGALIGAVVQGNEVIIPRGDYVIKPGSIVIGIATAKYAEELDDLFAETDA